MSDFFAIFISVLFILLVGSFFAMTGYDIGKDTMLQANRKIVCTKLYAGLYLEKECWRDNKTIKLVF